MSAQIPSYTRLEKPFLSHSLVELHMTQKKRKRPKNVFLNLEVLKVCNEFVLLTMLQD